MCALAIVKFAVSYSKKRIQPSHQVLAVACKCVRYWLIFDFFYWRTHQ